MNWIKNGSIVLFASILTLSFAEVGLRLFYSMVYQPIVSESKGNPSAYEDAEEFYGFIPQIALVQFYSKAGYRPVENYVEPGITSNELGLRSKLTVKDINNSKIRVIVSGGSTAWGAGVKDSDLFSNHFGGVTAGVGGYVFSNEFTLIRDVISREISIDHWVALSGWNDVYAAYVGESYYISPDMFSFESLIHGYTSNNRVFQTEQPPRQVNRKYSDYSVKLMFLLDKAIAKIKSMAVDEVSVVRGKRGALVKKKGPMQYEKFWRAFSQEVLLAAYWSNLNNVEFTFALQPSLYNTKKNLHFNEEKLLRSYEQSYLGLRGHYEEFYTRLVQDLTKLASAYQFNFIDADAAMIAGKSKDQYFVDHVHLGSKGNNALGFFLKEALFSTREGD